MKKAIYYVIGFAFALAVFVTLIMMILTPMGNTRRFLMQTIKIIKVPMGAYLDTKTTAFKIVDLNNKDIIDLDVGNMFYWKKKDAIKYINNSNQLKLKNKRGI
jgi:hypothetical protein